MAQAARKTRTSDVTLHIPVTAEAAQRLEARARAKGIGVADVARELLEVRVTSGKKANCSELSIADEKRRRAGVLRRVKANRKHMKPASPEVVLEWMREFRDHPA